MLILGIDPGTATTGYGLIQIRKNSVSGGLIADERKIFKVIDYGCLVTSNEYSMGERLKKLYHELSELLEKHKPDVLAIEQIFFFSNAKTVMSVGQAKGIAMLVAAQKNIQIYEYTPLQIKLELTNYGRAKKPEVQKRVKQILGISALKKDKTKKFKDGYHFDDAADALAVAVCHSYKNGGLKKIHPHAKIAKKKTEQSRPKERRKDG
ncbi:crossover junction endodeoxyribonuclease RuvC [candidate division WWE3 bacterium CG06_land_8_20_14_3_00_42_16]|uniref:Crossover junction endodeoxyribonuclease RuvC n=2 Tax=Katanobacteria TaxID=422282 RepID=A0A2M7ANH8_UNCKA|nr:MAG: crossover junction endodeoxyribonuclease RuvC [candidate division WWE3 bacterium CG06_land_8_20_14_3_00_42_16]PJA37364.1 MAG: crossover junction endodeoxyribonuclease RuvC [candidate division WWE3 bacterium CG_4_9_14_3_um_filter_43_9]